VRARFVTGPVGGIGRGHIHGVGGEKSIREVPTQRIVGGVNIGAGSECLSNPRKHGAGADGIARGGASGAARCGHHSNMQAGTIGLHRDARFASGVDGGGCGGSVYRQLKLL
jgi:hypothetical protein